MPSTKSKESGILKFICPACGFVFRYKRGRVKNPSITEVNKWLTKAQCRNCGIVINAYNRKEMDRGEKRKATK